MMEMAIGGDGHTMDNVYIYIHMYIRIYSMGSSAHSIP